MLNQKKWKSGSLRAFVCYEYNEYKITKPAPFIEGKHFHFAVLSHSNHFISELNECPKIFYSQL